MQVVSMSAGLLGQGSVSALVATTSHCQVSQTVLSSLDHNLPSASVVHQIDHSGFAVKVSVHITTTY